MIWLEKSLMNSNVRSLDDAVERAIGHVHGRLDQAIEIAFEKRGLAERTQPIVARRVGSTERRTGPPGQFVDHVAGG